MPFDWICKRHGCSPTPSAGMVRLHFDTIVAVGTRGYYEILVFHLKNSLMLVKMMVGWLLLTNIIFSFEV